MSTLTSLSAATKIRGLELSFERLNRNIVDLALPAVAENLLASMVFFADGFLIGWLRDAHALAAVGLGGTLLHTLQSVFQALAVSSTSMVAQLCGARQHERAARVAAQATGLAFVLALAVSALFWAATPVYFTFMGASAETARLGTLYIRLILVTSFAGYPMAVISGAMRGAGDTRTPMVITGLMNAWNVVAAAGLIFGPGPLPALGVAGAGVATASARLLGGALSFAILLRGTSLVRVRPGHLVQWDGRVVGTIVRLSLPTAGEAAARQTGSLLFMRIVAALGDVALAAHQIAVNVESLSFMPGLGMSVAGTTLVGQSLGADKPELARRSVGRTIGFSVVIMGAVGVLFALFGPGVAALFGATPAVVAAAGSAIRIGALEQIPLAVNMTLGGCLRGAGDMKSPMYATLAGVVLFRVPVVYLFAIVFGWGLNGVWLGTALDFCARALFLYAFYRRGTWAAVRLT
ncbi:MAG: MATE family efflux transporter [Anaerolineae bacterium]|nr:MATE family efflux transporter [Anaerolineae bacterium]